MCVARAHDQALQGTLEEAAPPEMRRRVGLLVLAAKVGGAPLQLWEGDTDDASAGEGGSEPQHADAVGAISKLCGAGTLHEAMMLAARFVTQSEHLFVFGEFVPWCRRTCQALLADNTPRTYLCTTATFTKHTHVFLVSFCWTELLYFDT